MGSLFLSYELHTKCIPFHGHVGEYSPWVKMGNCVHTYALHTICMHWHLPHVDVFYLERMDRHIHIKVDCNMCNMIS